MLGALHTLSVILIRTLKVSTFADEEFIAQSDLVNLSGVTQLGKDSEPGASKSKAGLVFSDLAFLLPDVSPTQNVCHLCSWNQNQTAAKARDTRKRPTPAGHLTVFSD